MNIRPRAGETLVTSTIAAPPTQARFARAYFLPWGCSCPRLTRRGLGAAKDTRAMPIDPRRRDDIVAAVAAHDSANPSATLPRNAARLLAAMFASEDVCQRSLEAIAAKDSPETGFPACCGAWSRLDCCRRQPGSARVPDTYRLHLPPVQP